MPTIKSFNSNDPNFLTVITFSRDAEGWDSAVDFSVDAIQEGATALVLSIDDDEVWIPIIDNTDHLIPREALEQIVIRTFISVGKQIRERREAEVA